MNIMNIKFKRIWIAATFLGLLTNACSTQKKFEISPERIRLKDIKGDLKKGELSSFVLAYDLVPDYKPEKSILFPILNYSSELKIDGNKILNLLLPVSTKELYTDEKISCESKIQIKEIKDASPKNNLLTKESWSFELVGEMLVGEKGEFKIQWKKIASIANPLKYQNKK